MSFHAELYRLIPEDHLLRKINQIVDFSLVFELVLNSSADTMADRLQFV